MPQEEKPIETKKEDIINNVDEKEGQKNKKPFGKNTLLIILIVISAALTVGCGILTYQLCNQIGYRKNPSSITYGNLDSRNEIAVRRSGVFYSDSSNTTETSGVVTSVSDNSFVLAGNGEKITIKTDSDTVYNTDDSKVSVNDSVVVYGTKSNGSFTAAAVYVNNN